MKLKSGTIISCPDCGTEQLKTTKELLPGAQLKEAEFESLGYDMEMAYAMGCHKCGRLWYRRHPKTGASQIHTKDNAWVSLSKEKPQLCQ